MFPMFTVLKFIVYIFCGWFVFRDCKDCKMLAAGNYDKSQNYGVNAGKVGNFLLLMSVEITLRHSLMCNEVFTSLYSNI